MLASQIVCLSDFLSDCFHKSPLLQGSFAKSLFPGSLQLSNIVTPFQLLGKKENKHRKVVEIRFHPIFHVKVDLPHCLRMELSPSK
jgi:hypothetical protein